MPTDADGWILAETTFSVANNRHYEGLFALGSGPLQQRAALEEGLSDDPQNRAFLRIMGNVTVEKFPDFKSRVGTYLPGLSAPHPTCLDQMVNLPTLHGFKLFASAERLDLEQCQISDYRRQLDLRTGTLRRELTWQTRRDTTLKITFERFISAARPHLMVLRTTIAHADGPPTEVRVLGDLDADVRTNGYDHFTQVRVGTDGDPVSVDIETNAGDHVAAAAMLRADTDLQWTMESAARWAGISGTFVLHPGGACTIDKFASLTSSRHTPTAPGEAARRTVWDAVTTGYETLAAENAAVWNQRWQATDVVIAGDPRSQLALRASLYHMLRAIVEGDRRCAIDAKGAAGEAYCGRYFWDTELFMLPLFLYTRPAVGQQLAAFRVHSLPGARRNAAGYGYRGAKYAWESSASGDENCPGWQYADHEVHVTADVAYGLWHAYRCSNHDPDFLGEAAEVLIETARYWRQRVHRHPDGTCELLMVMGPDEYTPFSRNNAYTNRLVALTLRQTGTAWGRLLEDNPAAAGELRERLGVVDEEFAEFGRIAEGLRVPYDAERGLVLQSDDFFAYEPLDFDGHWPDRTKRIGAAVSQERLYRSQVLKQADVVQLMALMPQDYTPEQMRTAYETYEPLTSHDSSLSKSMHAIVAAWIGKAEAALALWDESVGLDLELGEAAEGVHAACAGANWQVAVFGFAGVRTAMQAEALTIQPRLPARWQRLQFPFVWQQQALTITVEPGRVTVAHHGARPVAAVIRGQAVTLEPQETARFGD